MKKMQMTYFNKLMTFFILSSVLPVALLTILSYTFTTNILEEALELEASRRVEEIHAGIDQIFVRSEQILGILEEDEQIAEVMSDQMQADLHSEKIYEKIFFLMKANDLEVPLYILNREGEVLYRTEPYPRHHLNDYQNQWGLFRQLASLSGGLGVYPQNFKNSEGDVIAFTVGKTVTDMQGNVIGYMLIDVARTEILDVIYSLNSNNLDDIVIMDQFNYIVTDLKNPQNEGTFFVPENKSKFDAADSLKTMAVTESDEIMTLYHNDPDSSIRIVANVPLTIVNNSSDYIIKIILLSLGISVLLAGLVSYGMARNALKPIKILVDSMKKVAKGQFDETVDLNRKDEMKLLEDSYNRMVVKLKRSMEDEVEKQQKLRSAELKALQAQINPHFLYNTFDTIKWMAKMNKVDEVTTIVTELGSLFRNNIDNSREFVTVSENMEVIRSYVAIQLIRYDYCFSVEYDICEEVENDLVPKLIFQPIVENAITHGLSTEEDGLLWIKGCREGDRLVFIIQDNGVGMDEDHLANALNDKGSRHIGMFNVNQRIKLYYGDDYGISIDSKQGVGTKVTLVLPTRQIQSRPEKS